MQTRVRKVRTERPATLEDNENCRSCRVNPIPFGVPRTNFVLGLAQRGRDNRFNSPFGACQKSVDETVICQAKVFRQTLIEDKKGELGI